MEVDKFLQIPGNVDDEQLVTKFKFPINQKQKDDLAAMEKHIGNSFLGGRLHIEIGGFFTLEIKDQSLNILHSFGKHVYNLKCVRVTHWSQKYFR